MLIRRSGIQTRWFFHKGKKIQKSQATFLKFPARIYFYTLHSSTFTLCLTEPKNINMKFNKIFVTVGTTEFNNLIKKLQTDEVYEILKNHLICEEIKIQIGRGEKFDFGNFKEIKVEIFDLKDSIAKDIEEADLVSRSRAL